MPQEPRGDRVRVALVCERYPPDPVCGGIGTYAHVLATGLAAAGHQVTVLARTDRPPYTSTVSGVEVRRLRARSIPLPGPLHRRLERAQALFEWALAVRGEVRSLARQARIDVVEAPEYLAQSVLVARRLPVVVKLHTPTYLCDRLNGSPAGNTSADNALGYRAERAAARRATLVTSPSAALLADVAADWGLDPAAAVVVPNPLDLDGYDRGPSARATDEILYVGRLEPRKGVEVLAAAMAEVRLDHPAAVLRLVGGDVPLAGRGLMSEVIRDRVAGAGPGDGAPPVVHTDEVQRSALPAIYARAPIAAVPSIYENFPYTCLEAMAAGCAVVGSSTGGIPEIITDGVDGLLVPPGDPAALAVALDRLLGDAGLRARLGEAARATVRRRFSVEAVTAATVDAYRLAGERHAGATRS